MPIASIACSCLLRIARLGSKQTPRSEASSKSFLDFGSAAVCSFAYEALLSQRFHGDFRELMGWWRAQRGVQAQ